MFRQSHNYNASIFLVDTVCYRLPYVLQDCTMCSVQMNTLAPKYRNEQAMYDGWTVVGERILLCSYTLKEHAIVHPVLHSCFLRVLQHWALLQLFANLNIYTHQSLVICDGLHNFNSSIRTCNESYEFVHRKQS